MVFISWFNGGFILVVSHCAYLPFLEPQNTENTEPLPNPWASNARQGGNSTTRPSSNANQGSKNSSSANTGNANPLNSMAGLLCCLLFRLLFILTYLYKSCIVITALLTSLATAAWINKCSIDLENLCVPHFKATYTCGQNYKTSFF